MAETALVLLAIGDRMTAYRQLTEPYWKQIAGQLPADLIVLTKRMDSHRKLPAWQKLLLADHFASRYQQIIYADLDILPHPAVPLTDLMTVPEGKIGVCATSPFSSSFHRPKNYYSRALSLQPSEVTNVHHILNTGIMAWKTRGSDALKTLFRKLYQDAKQHCAEQSSLSWSVQQQGLHHLLPAVYNTNFIRTKPFPLNTFTLNKHLQRFKSLRPIARWSDRRTLLQLLAKPCFIHFVGGIFEDAIRQGTSLLQQQLTHIHSHPLPTSNESTAGFPASMETRKA